MFNTRKFIFPPFFFDQFIDVLNVPGGEISWQLLHKVFDKDEVVKGNLRKAHKLSYKALHPTDNKQSVPLALSIFDPTTSSAIESYFPDRSDAACFLKLINAWWTISNSKQKQSNWHLGNACIANDCKPLFLRKLADWFENWKLMQSHNSQKFTLSKQTTQAMVLTLKCTASLIEDLLADGYEYVLTSRFQTDFLELRFSKYRQMSGGRFLVGLREVQNSERILVIKSLLKESICVWREDLQVESCENTTELIDKLIFSLDSLESFIDASKLDDSGIEVAAVVSGYIAKKLSKKLECSDCKNMLVSSESLASAAEYEYLYKLSRGGLTVPSPHLLQYVAKSFAILDTTAEVIRNSGLRERDAAKYALSYNAEVTLFCVKHIDALKKLNNIVINIFLNNSQKLQNSQIRKNEVNDFKRRQRKRKRSL